jgi:3-methyl-2-oxobutanoate hydroxymethyltransferase
MSVSAAVKSLSSVDIARMKGRTPIVALTAYHAQTARLIDGIVDVILVGDSLGMVMHGMDTTVPVTMEMMILHGCAVRRAVQQSLIVVDMPFGSYEGSREDALKNAVRLLKETGCGAVKLEGGVEMAETIGFLVLRGVPVMAHVGMTPQSIHTLGSFRARGRHRDEWDKFTDDAVAVAGAGAFAVVVEAVAEPLAAKISTLIRAPTIGIGASPSCDGQILVLEDLLGFSDRVPKFVKRYAEFADLTREAARDFAADVRARHFPAPEHTYPLAEKP